MRPSVLLCLLLFLTPSVPGQTKDLPPPKRYIPYLEPVEVGPVYCTGCLRRRRKKEERRPLRLMEQKGEKVLADLKRPVYYLEWKHIKFVSQIPAVNLAVELMPKRPEERENWRYLKYEIRELKKVFPSARVGTLNAHQMAHFVMNRLIRYYLKFEREMKFRQAVAGMRLADYGMGPHLGMRAPFEIYVIRNKTHYLRWEDRFIGRKSIVGQKWMLFGDGALVFATYYHGNFPLFFNFLLHNVAHLYLWAYWGWTFKLPAWMHVGYAHYIERQVTPAYNTFCYDEGGEVVEFKDPKWEVRLAKMVRAGDYPHLAELKTKVEMPEVTLADHLVSWSVVRFLFESDREKWRHFVDIVSREKAAAQDRALKEAYGWSFNVLEAKWKEHVLATYPPP